MRRSPFGVTLRDVLHAIASANTMEELKAVAADAAQLPENEKEIARWSYAYAAHDFGRNPFYARPGLPIGEETRPGDR